MTKIMVRKDAIKVIKEFGRLKWKPKTYTGKPVYDHRIDYILYRIMLARKPKEVTPEVQDNE